MRRTFELLIEMAATCYAEGTDELFEVDCAVLVRVEHVEYIVCKLAGIAKWKELLVYAAELGLVELARGTVLAEALVPGRCERSGRRARGGKLPLLQLLLVD
jgi:hypothetical protein